MGSGFELLYSGGVFTEGQTPVDDRANVTILHLGSQFSFSFFEIVTLSLYCIHMYFSVLQSMGALFRKTCKFFKLSAQYFVVFEKSLDLFGVDLFDIFDNTSEVLDNIAPGGLTRAELLANRFQKRVRDKWCLNLKLCLQILKALVRFRIIFISDFYFLIAFFKVLLGFFKNF